jgi:hypothetical protein
MVVGQWHARGRVPLGAVTEVKEYGIDTLDRLMYIQEIGRWRRFRTLQ